MLFILRTYILKSNIKQKTSLYKTFIKIESLQKAFKFLKLISNPEMDGYTKITFKSNLNKSLEKLNKELKNFTYIPSPVKIIYILNDKINKRQLGIPSIRDKIVQISLFNLLSIIYEPIFYDCSYGFRPKKNCHSVLKQIKKKWHFIKWFLYLDIEKLFSKIQHNILINILQKQIKDTFVLNLIRKLLNVGYVDIHNIVNREKYMQKNIPKINNISTLFTNIYFHVFDEYVQEKLIPEYTLGEKLNNKNEKKKKNYYNLSNFEKNNQLIKNFPILKSVLPKLKYNVFFKNKKILYHKYIKNYFKRFYYIRYADEILIGLVTSKKDVKKIIIKINNFLNKYLKLNLNNCLINLSYEISTEFLGFLISKHKNKTNYIQVFTDNTQVTIVKSLTKRFPILQIPIKKILERLTKKGFIRKLKKLNKYKSKGVGFFTVLSDQKIVEKFSNIIKSYCMYYSCANYRSKLWNIIYLLKKSCYLTLAWKHKLKNQKKVIEKYGPKLRIHLNGKQITELYYPTTLKTILKFYEFSNYGSIEFLQNIDCILFKFNIYCN